ncbi:MAG TPA: NRDE family protein [Chitinophagaceae bacterium]|nr:NRDE family protein [Chitinophagaceae bacterium]
MCTVTFIPVRDKFFITSNRDEKYSRRQAIPPAVYQFESGKIIFPKDGDAGGSWIAMHENGNAAVLLNGAFEKHIPQPPYRLSRGQIFLHLVASENPVRRFDRVTLDRIEPFTLIVIERGDLFECRWDGNRKHCRQLRNWRHHIWSSATLYTEEVVRKREQWFAGFLNKNPNPTQEDILHFHRFSGNGDRANDLKMEREGLYSTVSITSILLTADRGAMKYLDLKAGKAYERKIEFTADYELL